MKNQNSIIFFLFCTIFINGFSDNQDAYIQMSSVATQIPSPGAGSLIVHDTINLIKNFEVTPKRDGIVCKVPGTYLIYVGLQPSTLSRGISGYLDTWFVINGIPIPSSTDRQYVDEHARVTLITNATLIQLHENDVLSTAFYSNTPNIGIIFIQSPLSSEPSITSFMLSAYKIN